MTTPEDDGPATTNTPQRPRRPAPERSGPNRGGAFAPKQTPPASVVGMQSPIAADDPVSEAIAHTVRTGYDVVAANIKAGRMAASRFHQGEYNIRDVPADVGGMARRLLTLAREVSATSFDVIEQLMANGGLAHEPAKAATGATAPPGSAGVAPSFHPTPTPVPPSASPSRAPAPAPAPASAPPGASPPASPAPQTVPITCEFTGSASATVTSAMLSRPSRPTHPEQLATTPLAAKDGGGPAIQGVTFVANATGDGLIARVPIPDGQPAGVYSTMIYAPSSDAPLGFLSIQVAG